MTKTAVTMKDIAQRVGVSRTAVSFVLNGRAEQHGLSPELVKQVLETTRQMNYAPPRMAKQLTNEENRKTMTIGVILPELSIGYGTPLVKNIEAQAKQENYHLILAQHENNSKLLAETIDNFMDRRVDGFVIVPTLNFHNLPIFKKLSKSGIPTVFTERDPDDDNINFVSFDIERSIATAVKKLASAGHTRIALYNAPAQLIESKLRLRAYCDTLDTLGLEYDPLLVKNAGLFKSATKQKKACEDLQEWNNLDSPPTAIIAISSNRAMTLFDAAESLGITIPGDFSLLAITGLEFGEFHRAQISSVKFSYENIGKVACQVLLENIKNPSMLARRVYIPATFVQGNTIKFLG